MSYYGNGAIAGLTRNLNKDGCGSLKIKAQHSKQYLTNLKKIVLPLPRKNNP
jgi:hypothetical protein